MLLIVILILYPYGIALRAFGHEIPWNECTYVLYNRSWSCSNATDGVTVCLSCGG